MSGSGCGRITNTEVGAEFVIKYWHYSREFLYTLLGNICRSCMYKSIYLEHLNVTCITMLLLTVCF